MAARNLRVVKPGVELDEIGMPRDEWGDNTPNGSPRCKGVKADGKRCLAFQGRRGFCYQHDPAITDAQRHASKVKGGSMTSTAARAEKRMLPPRLRSVFDRLDDAMKEVHDGTLSPARGQAMASIAGAAVRVLEAGELEEKIRKMERAAEGDFDGDLDDAEFSDVDAPLSDLPDDGDGA